MKPRTYCPQVLSDVPSAAATAAHSSTAGSAGCFERQQHARIRHLFFVESWTIRMIAGELGLACSAVLRVLNQHLANTEVVP